jgi:Mg2+ and Co2+ transporter CorA
VDCKHEHFDQYGDYQHWTVATHSLVTEEEYFDALEYFEVTYIVDDTLSLVIHQQLRSALC